MKVRFPPYGDQSYGDNSSIFIQAAGVAGAALFASGNASADDAVAPPSDRGENGRRATFMTELFLDNYMLESTPGVSRKRHQPKKHLWNPVIRCGRWCDGKYLQPYTTMYNPNIDRTLREISCPG